MRPNWGVEGARKRGWRIFYQRFRTVEVYLFINWKEIELPSPFLSLSITLFFLLLFFLSSFSLLLFFGNGSEQKGSRGKRRGKVVCVWERERERERESGARAVVKRELKLRKTFVRKWRSGIETAIFIIENLSRSMVHEIMFPRNDG